MKNNIFTTKLYDVIIPTPEPIVSKTAVKHEECDIESPSDCHQDFE